MYMRFAPPRGRPAREPPPLFCLPPLSSQLRASAPSLVSCLLHSARLQRTLSLARHELGAKASRAKTTWSQAAGAAEPITAPPAARAQRGACLACVELRRVLTLA